VELYSPRWLTRCGRSHRAKRIQEAIDTGADTLITGLSLLPGTAQTLRDLGSFPIEIRDLSTLAAESLVIIFGFQCVIDEKWGVFEQMIRLMTPGEWRI
jgi:hypothetical protein